MSGWPGLRIAYFPDNTNSEALMSNEQSTYLLKTLKQFGLNPEEWSLSGSLELFSTLLLTNKKDPEFKMIGHIGEKGWTRLQLLSI